MDKNLAEQLMKKLKELDAPFDDATDLVDEITDDAERLRFRKELGELAGNVYVKLMVPIFRQYPDLDPDKDIVFEEDDPLRWQPNPGKES